MSLPLVVFDLDGTLVDTAQDLIATLNVVLGDEGLPAVAVADARHLVGAGIKPLLERALRQQGADASPARVDRLYDVYLALYRARMTELSRPFPGLEAALDRLEARGFGFAVCTNKLEFLSVEMLDRLHLSRRFRAVCGGDTFPVRKPDAAHLLGTIARAGGDPARSVMVGDSEADVLVARNAGVKVIGVPFGYTPVPIEALGPDLVIPHYDELDRAVATLVG